MWRRLAAFIIQFRILLLAVLLGITAVMGYYGSKVELSYEFTNAIPTDNPKYTEYQRFRQQFGEDGNLMVVGVQTKNFFDPAFFNDYALLCRQEAGVKAVENILSVPAAIMLVKDTATQKLKVVRIAGPPPYASTDSIKNTFYSLPFYKGLLYNPQTDVYLMAISLNKQIINSKARTQIIQDIVALADAFGKRHNIEMHYSGLPFIRTQMATRVQAEMKLFLLLSFILTATILIIFFRSFVAVFASMVVVGVGVVWSVGTIVLLGYKITLLTALIPPLVVVIGIPNCVYFLNKYHTEYFRGQDKRASLLDMVDKMGIVTLFTNLTAGYRVWGVLFYQERCAEGVWAGGWDKYNRAVLYIAYLFAGIVQHVACAQPEAYQLPGKRLDKQAAEYADHLGNGPQEVDIRPDTAGVRGGLHRHSAAKN